MELTVSSPKTRGRSPSDCVSDPEEKEISDDDDDDRNHKHRKRESRSQSLERDALDQVLMRPYKKRNRPFENGHPYGGNDSQSSETWKRYHMAPLEKDLSAKFEKRRPGRGRGRESGSWSQRDPRFSSVDIASQMVSQVSVAPSLFSRRGLPNVSNSQSASWSAFGLIPGIPNGGMDTLHPLGLQGTFRSSINPSLNIGIPRQRCRDFEERGFCLRGDICPMEHGVNRIVVEDVQSLSQFNLPGSLPSAHLLGTSSALPSVCAPSNTLINSKSLHSKSIKPGMADDGLGINGVFTSSAGAGGADVYDPDQPLWTNDCPETSTALLGLNSSKLDETESLLDADPSDHHHVRLFDGSDNERLLRSTATAVGSQSTSSSMWGRIRKSKSEMKEKIDSTIISSKNVENEVMEDQEPLANRHGAAHQGKRIIAEDIVSQAIDSSPKTQGNAGRNAWKPSQKALRTLFINGIPQKDNKREALISHFRKFGEVIDIYIPLNSERAFVQFSKREEAEAALKAPDAVMGNRFIKLWWANRDSVPDHGISGNSVSVTPYGVPAVSVPPHLSVAHRVKDNLQSAAPKINVPHASVAAVTAPDHLKPVVNSSPKAPPPSHKKLEGLELLKEELRKKQELLDQKRNDFRRQLDKLEKQATGLKGEVSSEQAAKREKVGTVADIANATTPRSTDSGTIVASPPAEVMAEKNKSVENFMHQSSQPNTIVSLQEPSSLKHSIGPLAPAGAPFIMNRFKLDNRPTAFKIVPPLPTGLANVAALKEHFSAYGELSAVELEDIESSDSVASKNCSAHVAFMTRPSAERAFANGKCWQGCNLQFMWQASSNSLSASKVPSDVSLQPAGEVRPVDSQIVAASGNGESENLERKETEGEHMKQEEDMQSSSSAISCEKQSPNRDVVQ